VHTVCLKREDLSITKIAEGYVAGWISSLSTLDFLKRGTNHAAQAFTLTVEEMEPEENGVEPICRYQKCRFGE
jgi:hypothetical protein